MDNNQNVAKDAKEKAAKETVEKVVKNDKVFAKNPKLDVYYKTSDGTAFFTKNTAELHAEGLKDKTVKKITK
jgi:hypothetical protein